MWLGAGSVAALVVLRAPHVSAQTLGSVSVSGACPTDAQVVAALAARKLPDTARDYRLTVRSGRDYSEFALADRDGHALLDRLIASDDCVAMADVIALVTEAFFVELVDKGHPPEDTSAIVATRAAPAPATATESPATAAQSTAPPKSTPREAPPPAAPSAAPRPIADRPHRHLLLALGLGADVYATPNAMAPFGQLGAALYFSAPRFALELHAVAEAAATLQSAPDRVLRSETRVALRAERYFGRTALFAPWLGFGLAVSRSRALDLAGPVRHLAAPLAEGGVVLRAAQTGWLGVSAELGCHVLLVRERYVVAPDGHIGDGPAFGCQIGPNLTWLSPAF